MPIIYECCNCQKKFNTRSNLIKHYARKKTCKPGSHADDEIKLYKCDVCQAEFTRKDVLRDHKIALHSTDEDDSTDIETDDNLSKPAKKKKIKIVSNVAGAEKFNKPAPTPVIPVIDQPTTIINNYYMVAPEISTTTSAVTPATQNTSKKPIKRDIPESLKKHIAAKQRYSCANQSGNLPGLEGFQCPLWNATGVHQGHFDESGYEIDHIKEHCISGDDSPDNLQALCLPCHRVKTARFLRRGKTLAKNNMIDDSNS